MVKIPRKHAALIKAWADGAEIQWKYPKDTVWNDYFGVATMPSWNNDMDYRVKPEKKQVRVYVHLNTRDGTTVVGQGPLGQNVALHGWKTVAEQVIEYEE